MYVTVPPSATAGHGIAVAFATAAAIGGEAPPVHEYPAGQDVQFGNVPEHDVAAARLPQYPTEHAHGTACAAPPAQR